MILNFEKEFIWLNRNKQELRNYLIDNFLMSSFEKLTIL